MPKFATRQQNHTPTDNLLSPHVLYDGREVILLIGDTIRSLREQAGYSQAGLAKKLGVTRSSVNAWESGLSAPTAVYIIELSKLFHAPSDYILGLDNAMHLNLSGFSEAEIGIFYSLVNYFSNTKPSE